MFGNPIDSDINLFNKFEVEFCEDSKQSKLTEICLSSNAWITHKCEDSTEVITEYGLGNWTSDQTITSVYFHIEKSLKIKLFVKCKVPDGKSRLEFKLGQTSKVIDVHSEYYQWFYVTKFKIVGSGYIRLDMRGISKSGAYFADVSHLMFVDKYQQNIGFIRQINSDHTYWSRRGPSIHLSFDDGSRQNQTDEYYYNEVTVPEGFDPIGSYFMAIGFNHGYFGIQVNSETERRVLFSVWSPQETDDPNELLDENKVQIISQNKDIECNVFGCEGCGGQSILRYMWSTDITYKFLVRGRPDPCEDNHSVYTAWFAPKSDSSWKLIASFSRPKTYKYLSHFYSFVECFEENTSFMTRKAIFGNQWICNSSGVWREVTAAKLTGDSTAQNKVRHDFDGGVEEANDSSEHFYLKHCGFFKGKTPLLTEFSRKANVVFNEKLP